MTWDQNILHHETQNKGSAGGGGFGVGVGDGGVADSRFKSVKIM